MAITIDGKTFRNLEEQVQKNKEDIANHYAIDRVLANFGIKVVGQIADASGLPDPVTYEGSYGDAYAVGAVEPYNFYIYTRPDVNSGHPDNYWLDVGGLAIVGPQGPQGIQGPQGETGASSTWFAGVSPPFENNKNGDMFLQLNSGDATGNVYRYVTGSGWQGPVGNIRGPQGAQGARGLQGVQGPQGPQGPQGVQGPQGTPGQTFYVEGTLENTGQLPIPTQAIRAGAYLIPSETVSGEYDMWVIVGGHNEGDELTWFNAGRVTTDANALKLPQTAPESTEIVAIDNTGAQTALTIGEGLSVENGTLKSMGGGGNEIIFANRAACLAWLNNNQDKIILKALFVSAMANLNLTYNDILYVDNNWYFQNFIASNIGISYERLLIGTENIVLTSGGNIQVGDGGTVTGRQGTDTTITDENITQISAQIKLYYL